MNKRQRKKRAKQEDENMKWFEKLWKEVVGDEPKNIHLCSPIATSEDE